MSFQFPQQLLKNSIIVWFEYEIYESWLHKRGGEGERGSISFNILPPPPSTTTNTTTPRQMFTKLAIKNAFKLSLGVSVNFLQNEFKKWKTQVPCESIKF